MNIERLRHVSPPQCPLGDATLSHPRVCVYATLRPLRHDLGPEGCRHVCLY